MELSPPLSAGENRLPQVAVIFTRSQTRFQDTRILSFDILQAIAGDLGKRGVDVLKPALEIGESHGHGDLLHGVGQFSDFLLHLLALGLVYDADYREYSLFCLDRVQADVRWKLAPILTSPDACQVGAHHPPVRE